MYPIDPIAKKINMVLWLMLIIYYIYQIMYYNTNNKSTTIQYLNDE